MNNSTFPETAVFDSLHQLMHLYRGLLHQAILGMDMDLTVTECKTIIFFAHHPQATLSDLTLHCLRDKAQLNRIIRQLKERSLLAEQKDSHDKRKTLLTLTESGQAVFAQLQTVNNEIQTRALHGLQPEIAQQMSFLLRDMITNLSEPSV